MTQHRFPYRKLETLTRNYIVERVEVSGASHFEMTVRGMLGEVIEEGTVFNTKREADTGLLDRACLR